MASSVCGNLVQLPGMGEMQREEGILKCFYPNKCHVCHCFDSKDCPLKRCSNCQLMSYCGREHQVIDWENHKDFCKAIKLHGGPKMFNILKEYQDPLNATIDNQYLLLRIRVNLKKSAFYQVISHLKRAPFLFEMEMFLYPRMCLICYESDPSLLKNCHNCPQGSFCNKHKDDPSHLKLCPLYRRACEIDVAIPNLRVIFQNEVNKERSVTFPYQNKNSKLPMSMKDFLETESCITINRNAEQKKVIPQSLWEIYLTNALSPVLTVLYAIEKLEFPEISSLSIHVIGANFSEMYEVIWELILHWLPAVKNLSISFIGPETESILKPPKIKLCPTCQKKKIKVTVNVTQDLYQDYMESKGYQKPNIVVAYNAGLHAYKTWIGAIKKVASLRCPFIQTSFTEVEAHQDFKTIKSVLPKVKSFIFGANPFASYYCQRNTDDEKVFIHSDILTIYDTV